MSETNPSNGEPSVKRRKVRKGTRNCWECRRRKVRCIFASPEKINCDNCMRRGTTCISQDQHDTGTQLTSTSRNHVEARLGRVEEFVERFVHTTTTAAPSASSSTEDLSESETSSEPRNSGEDSTPVSLQVRLTTVKIRSNTAEAWP
jgi:hypothetical protein